MQPAMLVKLNKGLTIPLAGEPRQVIDDLSAPSRVALLGYDYAGVRKLPSLQVAVGDSVRQPHTAPTLNMAFWKPL